MKRRRRESGFAMLLVLMLSACVAITLYMELPRVAFQAERQKEIQLVDRGNQFKRAIQVFVTDKVNNPTHRYPASLDELESFNNHRYLRRRYFDPMTGKDEWRLVHINGGVLTDSVTSQGKGQASTGSSSSTGPAYISENTYIDSASPAGQGAGGATRALRGRPSDSLQPGGAGDPNAPGGSQGMQGNAGGPPGAGIVGMNGMGPGGSSQNQGMPGQPTLNGFPPGGQQQQQQQQQNCYIGSCDATTTNPSGQQQAGQFPSGQGMPGGVTPGSQLNAPAVPGGQTPGIPGAQGSQGGAPSAAASLINGLLTTPRPGGMPSTMPGATVGGGIAGVASKFEAEGIMVINDRTAINEWEYIFDATKYRPPPNPLSGPAAMPQQGQPAGTPASQMGSMPPPLGSNPSTSPGGGRQQ